MLFRSFYGKLFFSACFLVLPACYFSFTASGFISRRIFHTPEAGNYILTLAFICPFLYSNTALISVLNGLDLAGKTFLINLFTLAVRICGVLFLIPQFGILGYLWALLASQLLTFGCCMFLLIKQGR
ncbi:MAG: polysaccharide biosynthesis C-terminal domain-containing protein [Coprococcus sp.]